MSDHIRQQDNRIAKLEARLGILPGNSSVPPSSQHPHAKIPTVKPKSKRKRGGQQGHKKSKRELVPIESVDQVIPCIPAACRRCGGELIGRDSESLRDQVYELPEIKPDIIEYQRHRLCCPKCGITTCGTLPEGVPTQSAGPRLTAFVSLLMAHYRQSNAGRACFSNRLSDKRTHNNQQSRIRSPASIRGSIHRVNFDPLSPKRQPATNPAMMSLVSRLNFSGQARSSSPVVQFEWSYPSPDFWPH